MVRDYFLNFLDLFVGIDRVSVVLFVELGILFDAIRYHCVSQTWSCIVRLVEELKSLSVSILCMLFYRLPHDDKISIQNDGSTITVSGDSADLRG